MPYSSNLVNFERFFIKNSKFWTPCILSGSPCIHLELNYLTPWRNSKLIWYLTHPILTILRDFIKNIKSWTPCILSGSTCIHLKIFWHPGEIISWSDTLVTQFWKCWNLFYKNSTFWTPCIFSGSPCIHLETNFWYLGEIRSWFDTSLIQFYQFWEIL